MTARPRRNFVRRTLIVIASLGLLPTLAACPKKHEPVVVDAEAPPPPVDAAPTVLAPLDDDASVDVADAKPHTSSGGHAQDPFVTRLKQCCSALTKQAKEQGNPPDIMPAVNMCNQVAAQLAANPNAPELNALRPLLKATRNLPPPCQGL
jgi:hypothetical protein